MNNIIKILHTQNQKIPFWKVDIVQNLNVLNSPIPRKTHISGHFANMYSNKHNKKIKLFINFYKSND